MASSAIVRSSPWRTVWAFWICFVIATLDRQVIAITGGSIQKDLHLTDTQLGFVQGPAFAFCAAFAGVPVGWLLDRGNRVKVSAVCFAIWSATTSLTALATSFTGLALARSGGALGEAGLAPAALSIFADTFPPREIPRASSAFLTAPFVGAGLGLFCGGFLLDIFTPLAGHLPGLLSAFGPWQLVFLAVGFPGFFVALALPWIVKDPARRPHPPLALDPSAPQAGKTKTAWLLVLFVAGMTSLVILMYIELSWLPIRFMRSFGTTPSQTGAIIGPLYVVPGLSGALLAGWLSSRGSPKRVLIRVLDIIVAATALLIVPFAIAALAPDKIVAAGGFFVGSLCLCTALTLAASPIQLLVSTGGRARALAFSTVAFNVVGAGLGPLLVGVGSDRLGPRPNAIGESMVLVGSVSVLVGLVALLGVRRTLRAGSAANVG